MEDTLTTYSSGFQFVNFESFIMTTSLVSKSDKVSNLDIHVFCDPHSDTEIQLHFLSFQSYFFSLSKALICMLRNEMNVIYLTNDEFNISAWGNTNSEALEAFSFQFYSLYINFALEADENLSIDAKIIKSKMTDLISYVF